MSDEKTTFDCFAVVEVFGRMVYAGRVSEQAIGGSSFVRVDVPAIGERPGFTKLFGQGSIFCITPCTEEVANAKAAEFTERPITIYAPMLSGPKRNSDPYDCGDEWDGE